MPRFPCIRSWRRGQEPKPRPPRNFCPRCNERKRVEKIVSFLANTPILHPDTGLIIGFFSRKERKRLLSKKVQTWKELRSNIDIFAS